MIFLQKYGLFGINPRTYSVGFPPETMRPGYSSAIFFRKTFCCYKKITSPDMERLCS